MKDQGKLCDFESKTGKEALVPGDVEEDEQERGDKLIAYKKQNPLTLKLQRTKRNKFTW
jgi:hypothetical protein